MTAEPTVTSGMATVDAIALLPLPALSNLSEPQLTGHVCVWGGEALTPETAVDLGKRKLDARTVFPRGCLRCVERAAVGVLFGHSAGCEDCDAGQCDTGRALNRVIRLGRR